MYARIYGGEGGLQFVLLAQLCRLDVSTFLFVVDAPVWYFPGKEFLTPVYRARSGNFRCKFSFVQMFFHVS